jgi:hypothetical protein
MMNEAPTYLVHIEHTRRGICRHNNFHLRQERGDQRITDLRSSSHMGGQIDHAEES